MNAIDTSIKWFTDRKGKVTYSMDYRNGPKSYDCSSAVYYALIAAKLLPKNIRIGNTDSLFGDLERNGWVKLKADKNGVIAAKKGDVFIWGVRGASGGAFGHTGLFTNANDIIHCNAFYNGIHVNNHDWLSSINGYPELTVYRYTGATPATAPKASNTDQILEVGSTIKFANSYTVDDLKSVGDIWQVRSNALCKKGFTWADNGIPCQPLYEVDKDGYATVDQELIKGARFKLPGKFTVLDLGLSSGRWLTQIQSNGLKFWVDVATATEIKSTDAGTPNPGKRPAAPKPVEPPKTPPAKPPVTPPVVVPPKPVEQPPVEPSDPVDTTPVVTEPEQPQETLPPVETAPETPINKPKEDTPMAFDPKQQAELAVASEKAQDVAATIAGNEIAKDLVSGISKKTKLIVYFVGDTLLWGAAVTPQVVSLLTAPDAFAVATNLSSIFATSGLFLLTMFGIYKSGQK